MHVSTAPDSARELLAHLHRAGVAAAHGKRVLVANSRVLGNLWQYEGGYRGEAPLRVPLPAPAEGRVLVVGAGKAAGALAQGLEAVLGDRIHAGAIVVKYGHAVPLRRIRCFEAAHPVPDQAGVAATRELLRILDQATARDTVFCLLTGGASALLVEPAEGLSLEEKATAGGLLVNSGASIHEVNLVRKHLSAVKGGRLRLRTRCRAFCTLAISDVPGDDPASIGSGPTVRDDSSCEDALAVIDRYGLRARLPAAVLNRLLCGASGEPLLAGRVVARPHAEPPSPKDAQAHPPHLDFDAAVSRTTSYRIVAGLQTALDACASEATRLGLSVSIFDERMTGCTADAARGFAGALREVARGIREGGPARVLLAGGETTLEVRGAGRGGRNQQFALIAARTLQDVPGAVLLAAGTDGTDGPTDAAGAFADASSWPRARALGLDPEDHLRRNDVYPLFEALHDLYRSGPTGTNVMDLVIGVAGVAR